MHNSNRRKNSERPGFARQTKRIETPLRCSDDIVYMTREFKLPNNPIKIANESVRNLPLICKEGRYKYKEKHLFASNKHRDRQFIIERLYH